MFRGHLKLIILKALAERDSSGYDLMKRLQEKLGCKPSPGSLYPLLDELAAQDLVSSHEAGKSKVYAITAKGKAELKAMQQRKGEILQAMQSNLRMWGMLSGDDVSFQLGIFERLARDEAPFGELSKDMWDLKQALGEAHKVIDPVRRKEIKKVLNDAARRLRRLA
jgi:DNA-binding PadR family transcriptional regulator